MNALRCSLADFKSCHDYLLCEAVRYGVVRGFWWNVVVHRVCVCVSGLFIQLSLNECYIIPASFFYLVALGHIALPLRLSLKLSYGWGCM